MIVDQKLMDILIKSVTTDLPTNEEVKKIMGYTSGNLTSVDFVYVRKHNVVHHWKIFRGLKSASGNLARKHIGRIILE